MREGRKKGTHKEKNVSDVVVFFFKGRIIVSMGLLSARRGNGEEKTLRAKNGNVTKISTLLENIPNAILLNPVIMT